MAINWSSLYLVELTVQLNDTQMTVTRLFAAGSERKLDELIRKYCSMHNVELIGYSFSNTVTNRLFETSDTTSTTEEN